jgi:phosphoribosylanthranilate isomerase
MRVKVKICGITNAADALAAVEAGADALGFMFSDLSPRYLTREAAAKIIRQLPPFVVKVGVFVNAPEAVVKQAVAECGLDALQFHGTESPEYCGKFAPQKVIKAVRVRDSSSLKMLSSYETDAWLMDSWVPGKLGGTGETFRWELAAEAKDWGKPIILAGGLKPENVAQAVHEVWPYAVDVSSGVEESVGKKDHSAVRDFISAVRQIDNDKF